MTDDQIINDVLKNLNKWDRDNRNTTMPIPFYIRDKFKLEERKCFDLTTQMVKAGLVRRFRDNDYLITDKGRKIGDTANGWLGKPITTQPDLSFLLALNSTTQITKTSPKKNEIAHQVIKVLIEYIKKWWWTIFIPLIINYASHYMEYNWFIPKQNQNISTDSTNHPV